MNLNSLDISKITVLYHGRKVGYLTMDDSRGVAVFKYDRQWLADGFSISPMELPLKADFFIAKADPFASNFGIFEDSLPDGYGRYLLHRMLRDKGIDYLSLNPLQRLSLVGSAGMGALCYEPASYPQQDIPLPEFDAVQQMALNVLSEKASGDEDVLYFNSGNSGGCRPKCLYSDSAGHWLVKFRHTYNPINIGKTEYLYYQAAIECGIGVPDFKLINNMYFASRRFDIDADDHRLHVATAAALLCQPLSPPMCDYKTLLQLTGVLTQSESQVIQMYRRMVFNVFSKNKDDHAKNFSFIYRMGGWTLAPAYDLNYNPTGYNGEHATSVNYNGNPSVQDMISVGKSIKIPEHLCRSIIKEIRPICERLLDNIK